MIPPTRIRRGTPPAAISRGNIHRYYGTFRQPVIDLIRAAYKPEDRVINTRTLAWHAAQAGTIVPESTEKHRTQIIGGVVYRNLGGVPYSANPVRRGRTSYVLPVPVGELR